LLGRMRLIWGGGGGGAGMRPAKQKNRGGLITQGGGLVRKGHDGKEEEGM